MKVFLTSAYPINSDSNFTPLYLNESQKLDPFKIHQITNDPDEADLIIFAEHHPGHDQNCFEVLRNDIYKKHKKKCYLYHDHDRAITLIPTIVANLEQENYVLNFTEPFWLMIQLSPNNFIRQTVAYHQKKYLFSFVGASRTHPIRQKILEIKCDRSYLKDTFNQNSWEISGFDKEKYQKEFADICFNSKFILCPRGIGANSYRLYESMEIGVAPVIISDDWVPMVGPKWEEFSIRVPQADIDKIAEILELREPESERMGKLARQAWENWFAKDKQFHYIAEAALKLHNSRNEINFFTYFKQYLKLLKPYYLKVLLRDFRNKVKRIFN
jgi:hypothetical protein